MPPSNCCSAPMTPVQADEGTGYYECSECKKPCDPAKPFTLDGVLGEFDEEMADAFWLHPDDKMGREASSSRVKSFIAQHFKSAFSELMEVVPKNALAEGWEKRGLPNEYDMAWTRGHRAARSALLAKGREMGLGE